MARREHSCAELSIKLSARGWSFDVIDTVLSQLHAEGLQSDERFTESYLMHRSRRGFGPSRICAELAQRGVDRALVNRVMADLDVDWFESVASVRLKKFGQGRPTDIKARAKQTRYLEYRGFVSAQIKFAFEQAETP